MGLVAPSRFSCTRRAGVGRSWTSLIESMGCAARIGHEFVVPRSSRAWSCRSLGFGKLASLACCCPVGWLRGWLALSAGCSARCRWTGVVYVALVRPIRMNLDG